MIVRFENINKIPQNDYDRCLNGLSPEKSQKIKRFRFDQDKKRSLAGIILAKKCVGEFCDIPADDVVVLYDNFGKPYVDIKDVYINISHSGDYAIYAVCDSPVGVDIEKLSDIDHDLTRNTFSKKECDYILSSASADGLKTRFYEIWTLKEAYAKYLGKGINEDILAQNILELKKCNNQSLSFYYSDEIPGYAVSCCYYDKNSTNSQVVLNGVL